MMPENFHDTKSISGTPVFHFEIKGVSENHYAHSNVDSSHLFYTVT